MKEGKIISGKYSIKITHPEKVLYPGDGYTKTDIANYYQKIAKTMLPHIHNRPISMQHFPDGIKKEGFYQKQIPDYFPKWFKRFKIQLHSESGSQQAPVVEKEADLIYLANQAVLIPHIWLSKIDHINKPDKIIYDLDPSTENDLQDIKFAARKIKSKLEGKGFTVYIMTTGSKGFHVVIPIKPTKNFDQVRNCTRAFSEELVEEYPDKFTTEISIAKRKGRLFLDYLRNSYGQTSVCPYSLRALPKAPIATPINWNELERINPQSFNLSNIFKRLGAKGDPWRDFAKKAKRL